MFVRKMSSVNKSDGELCMRYAERVTIYNQILKLKRENHNTFKHVKFNATPWDYKHFGGMPSKEFLKAFPTDFSLTFDQIGCETISAFCVGNVVSPHCQFPSTDMNLTCTSLINDNLHVKFCQENCFKSNFPLDLYWDRKTNSCKLINLPKKIFCLKPHQDNRVPPLFWDQETNSCKMSENYCNYFGLSYNKKGNCYNPKIQSFLEDYIFGKTIIRTLVHPTIIFSHAGDGGRIPYSCQQASNKETADALAYDVAKDFAISTLPEVGIHTSNAALQYLMHFTRKLDSHLVKSVILLEINNYVREKLILNALKYITKISNLVYSPHLLMVFILGSILDISDNLQLGKSLTSTDFDEIMTKFDKSFKEDMPFDSITPERILDFEVLQLKEKNQIEKAFELKYGGISQLIRNINIYLGKPQSLVSKKIRIKQQFNNALTDWPIRGMGVFFQLCLITTLSIACTIYTNTYLLIILIIATLMLVFYLKINSNWN